MTYTIEYSGGTTGAAGVNACIDDTSSTWVASPAAVPGNDSALAAQGIYTAVSKVRITYVIPSTLTTSTTYSPAFSIGYTVLDSVVSGDRIGNWGAQKVVYSTTSTAPTTAAAVAAPGIGRNLSTYVPGNDTGANGDRVSVQTAVARLAKQVRNVADTAWVNTVPVHNPGDSVSYRLAPTLTAGVSTGNTADTYIQDCLPLNQTFVASRVEGTNAPLAPSVISNGAPTGATLACAAGRTYLRWNLGELVVNSIIPAIIYDTTVDSTATNGLLTNTAMVTATGDTSLAVDRTRSAQIQITTPVGIKLSKTTLAPQVEVNAAGIANPRVLPWTIRFAAVDTTGVSNADIIDILPSNGLNGSTFTGTLAFQSSTATTTVGTAQLLYTKTPSASLVGDPASSTNLAAGSTVWCSAPAGGTVVLGAAAAADCPSAPAQVTGVRVRVAGSIPAGAVVTLNLTMIPSANAKGDIYNNSSSANATGVLQGVGPVTSAIRVLASSIGDTVWRDVNGNGLQDAGEPGIAGFRVTLAGTDSKGNPVSRTATTDANGKYLFPGLASGSYTVTFNPADLAAYEAFTGQNAGDDTLDSDGDITTGATAPIGLGIAIDNMTVDQGVRTREGSLTLGKTVIDPNPYDQAGDATSYPVTVSCTGPTGYAPVVIDATVPADGSAVVVAGLRVGSSCTLAETDADGGTASYSPAGPYNIGDAAQTVAITNTFPGPVLGSIELSKIVVDPNVYDRDGDAVSYPMTVSCTGPTGYPDVSKDAVVPADGTAVTVDGLYLGSSCTVTENDTDGGTATYSPAGPYTVGAAPVEVAVTNTFAGPDLGSIALSKTVVDPNPYDAEGDAVSYPVTVSCTGPAGYPAITRDATIPADGTPVTIDGLYQGSACTVTETDTDGGAAAYSPPSPVTVGAAPVAVAITNTFPGPDLGELSLTKAVVDPNPYDGLGDAASYPVTVTCTGPTGYPAVSKDAVIGADGTPTVVGGLYQGSSCTVAETDTDGGTATYSVDGPIAIGRAATAVTVTNTFPAAATGQIVVTKAIVDPNPYDVAGTSKSFPITVSCTGPDGYPAVTKDAAIDADGTPTVIAGLYAGSSCTIEETGTDGGTPAFSANGPYIIGAGDPVTVTITNTFPAAELGAISLTKVIVDADPTDADGDATSFPVTISCTGPTGYPAVTRQTSIPADGTTVTVDGLYVGSDCAVAETDTDGGTASYSADEVTVGADVVAVTVTNTYGDHRTPAAGNPADESGNGGAPLKGLPWTGSEARLHLLLGLALLGIGGFLAAAGRRRRQDG